MFALTLFACTGDGDTAPDTVPPPFDLDGASAYWITRMSYYDSLGVLLISKEADCNTLSEQYLFNDLDAELYDGEGLIFLMNQDTWGGNDSADDFTGLWMGYAFGDNVERRLSTLAYSSGLLYILEWGYSWYYGYGSTGSWVRIDSQDGTVRGAFNTDWWWGDFEAEDCGSWDSGWYPDESGWESGGWDDTWVESGWWWDDTGDDTGCPDYDGPSYIGIESSNCESPGWTGPAAQVDCDSAEWWADVYTVGWVEGGDVALHGDERVEVHPISTYDFDPDGWWDNLYGQFTVVDEVGDVVEGSTTAFACADNQVTWAITVYTDGDEDCVVGGFDPEGLGSDCKVWE